MTVETVNDDGTPVVRSGPYNGNGITTVFGYNFLITSATDIKVTRQNANLSEDILTLTTDYTVTGIGSEAGGTIVLVDAADAPTGSKLVIQLDMDFKQSTDYSNQGRIQLALLETSLDRLTLTCRQLRESMLRAVTIDSFGTANLAQLRTNVNALAAIEAQITTVAANIANVNTVSANMADIDAIIANLIAVQNAAANAIAAANSATAASNSATAASNSATAAAAASADFLNYGLGVAGAPVLLANIDATNIKAGVYFFDGTTLGTYPTGIVAADTGLIELWRQAAGTALMELHHATSDKVFRRRMTASVWGAWREVISANQNAVEGDILYRSATAWTRLAKGSALQVLRQNAGLTAPEWGSVKGTSNVAVTTSGTTHDLTGVPTTAMFFTLHCLQVSLSGSGGWRVQLLDAAGSPITAGYTSTFATTDGVTVATSAGPANAFQVYQVAGVENFTGRMNFARVPGTDDWIQDHVGRRSGSQTVMGGGFIAAGNVTGVRLLPSGAYTFDSGSAFISWEA
jgi:hypothetical protein